MEHIHELMCNSLKDYREHSAILTKTISDYFAEEGLGVTVSVNEVYVELFYKPPRTNKEIIQRKTNMFYQLVDGMPELFNLEPLTIESRVYKKMELEEDYNTFYEEVVVLRGVKNG